MSKLFFKGRIDARENYQQCGYNTKREKKPGTKTSPLSLRVTSEERQAEVAVVLAEHALFANIEVDANATEDLTELEVMLKKPKTQVAASTPKRNDPCSCGSGKKYKKCCG